MSSKWKSVVVNYITNIFVRRSEPVIAPAIAAQHLKLSNLQKTLIADRFKNARKISLCHVKPTPKPRTTPTTDNNSSCSTCSITHRKFVPIVFQSAPGAHRMYVDEVCTQRESRILINAFNDGLLNMGLDQDDEDGATTKLKRAAVGESVINPLYGGEEVLGPVAFSVLGVLKERMQRIAEEVHGVKLHDSGALLARLRIPEVLRSALHERYSRESGDFLDHIDKVQGLQGTDIPGGYDQLRRLICSTYATPHIDKANRLNYDVSCVLYLNDSAEWLRYKETEAAKLGSCSSSEDSEGDDEPLTPLVFEGGRFVFNDEDGLDTVLVPRRGRLLVFDSGPENMHQVQHVLKGSRYTLAVWFTKDDGRTESYPMY